jgi:hypothetical protein
MPSKVPGMYAEFVPAILTLVYIAIMVIGVVAAFRFAVPAILNAHFTGSTYVAAVAGLVCFVALAYFGVFAVRHVRWIYEKTISASDEESTDK